MTNPNDWHWTEGGPPPRRWLPYGAGLEGRWVVAQGRCIFCGYYVWSMRDLIEHFQTSHGRYVA